MPTGTPVPTPAVTVPLHNLLDGANVITPSNKEWENGVSFTQFGCYVVTGDSADYCDPDIESFPPQDCIESALFVPYVLELDLMYATRDRGTDIADIGMRTMEIGSSSRLERFIWSGSSGADQNPTLDGGTSLGANAAPKIVFGNIMAALVAAETHTVAQGTIHMSPAITPHLEGLFREDDEGVLRTVIGGHKVIVGNYPSTHIAAHIGDIDVYLSEPYVNEAPDEVSRVNDQLLQIQRLGVAAWNHCAAFIQGVTIT